MADNSYGKSIPSPNVFSLLDTSSPWVSLPPSLQQPHVLDAQGQIHVQDSWGRLYATGVFDPTFIINQPSKEAPLSEKKPFYTTSSTIMLVEDSIRPVRVNYDPDHKLTFNDVQGYMTLDRELKVGDYVSVPTNTRHGYTIGKVAEIDFDVDFDQQGRWAWIIEKVDLSAYERTVATSEVIMARVNHAQAQDKKAKLKAALALGDVDLSDVDLTGTRAALQAPPAPQAQQPAEPAQEVYDYTSGEGRRSECVTALPTCFRAAWPTKIAACTLAP